MKTSRTLLTRIVVAPVVALATFMLACREAGEPTAPAIQAAKGGRTGDPTVSSVVPDSSRRGVTLDITVNGSGYDQGSVVRLERGGVPAAKITTNSTTFLNPRKLTANITIAADADTGKYDVAVTTSGGRKGVGIELFTVVYQLNELGMFGGNWSRAHAINDRGEVVGESCTQDCVGHAFYWTEAGGLEDLGTLPGYTRSDASAINSRGQVFGRVFCAAEDPECGGVYAQRLVRWDRAGGSWTITPVNGCSWSNSVEYGQFLINNNDQCLNNMWNGSAWTVLVQTLSGSAVVSEQPLPSVFPGGNYNGWAISDAPMVAGQASAPGMFPVPVVWYRTATGSWAFLRLNTPATDNSGRGTDISMPDAGGRVRVSGYTEELIEGTRSRGDAHAVRWTLQPDGSGGWQVASLEVLPTPSGGPGTGPSAGSFGRAVNVHGDVVGVSNGYLDHGGTPAFWPVAGGIEVLPTPGRGGEGRPVDINSDGWIVGAVYDQDQRCDRAAIWRQK